MPSARTGPWQRRRLGVLIVALGAVVIAAGLWFVLGDSGDDAERATIAPTTPTTVSPTTVPPTTTPPTTTPALSSGRYSAPAAYSAGPGSCPSVSAYDFALQDRTVTLVTIGGSAVAGSPSAIIAPDGNFFLTYQTPGGVSSTIGGRLDASSVSGTAKQGDCIYTFSGKRV